MKIDKKLTKGKHSLQIYIEDNLKNNDHLWRICSWSKNMTEMQVGGKTNTVGWEVYENCKNNGAIIATAHEHTYHRTKTLVDIQNQIVDSIWSKPDKIKVDDGSTFVFVSGMGGWSIRDQDRCLPRPPRKPKTHSRLLEKN